MPINYTNDTDYETRNDENQDKLDVMRAKLDEKNKEASMDFDEFLIKEGIPGAVHNKNSK